MEDAAPEEARALASPRDTACPEIPPPKPASPRLADPTSSSRASSPRLDAAAAKALQLHKASLEAQLLALGGMKLKPLAAEPVCADEGGSHWDYALKEMQWMSNDFRMERKWKTQSARKLVRDCERVIDKKETERKRARVLEQARMRKVANGIARAVKKSFWEKVDRVVLFKANTEHFTEQEKLMSRNLEHLLSQTEKYTKALINASAAPDYGSWEPDPVFEERELKRALARVMRKYADDPSSIQEVQEAEDSFTNVEKHRGSEEEASSHLMLLEQSEDGASPNQLDGDDDAEDEDFVQEGGSAPEDDEESLARDEALGGDDGGVDALMADNEIPIEELRARYADAPPLSSEDEAAVEDAASAAPSKPSLSARTRTKAAKEDAAPASAVDGTEDSSSSDADFVASERDESDDEESLARDEALGSDDGGVDALMADNEISIEELRARYADAPPLSDDEDDGEGATEEEEASAKVEKAGSHLANDKEKAQLAPPSAEEGNADVSSSSSSTDDDFVAEEESDDENSLAHDEALGGDDGGVDALMADNEIPIEELRARYAGVLPVLSDEGDIEEEEEEEEKPEEAHSISASVAGETPHRRVPIPFLLSSTRPLREYQRAGLDWLVSLHDRALNGILADEMGLGKTIQTVALLAHLAGARGIWGPHLIIVPTSVILNWQMELKTWCPALRVLTYFGSPQERAEKRAGWTKPNAFHVCITSYQLAVQDAAVFRRKRWYYLILDEAHALKNAKSQRWQTLMQLNTKRRLLLTGTPLQNSLMELWSLMHFLMPHVFRSQAEFKHWFANPLTAMVEQGDEHQAAVDRLHAVLRPFILRRLKVDVAKQLPAKVEHVVTVPLARRQRFLYEDFISRASTRETLAGGGYLGMMSILMKLRMVCNHPDLLEPRPIATPFECEAVAVDVPRLVFAPRRPGSSFVSPLPELCLGPASGALAFDSEFGLGIADRELDWSPACCRDCFRCAVVGVASCAIARMLAATPLGPADLKPLSTVRWSDFPVPPSLASRLVAIADNSRRLALQERGAAVEHHSRLQARRLAPVFGFELIRAVSVGQPLIQVLETPSIEQRVAFWRPMLDRFLGMYLPGASAASVVTRLARLPYRIVDALSGAVAQRAFERLPPAHHRRVEALHPVLVRQAVSFPDKLLVQYDCGKLQALAKMLQRLKQGNHRVLIFTQMTRMLDILERFLNLHAYTYFRLDGATKVEDRQVMMERFNRDPRIFVFILSTRSGGLGINLVGADTVIFYDSDWNPAMDAQAQDRAHRIGQTRDVHIYRLVSERTVEENIYLKSNQKRHLNRLTVEDGNFVAEALGLAGGTLSSSPVQVTAAMAAVEDEADTNAAARARAEEKEDLEDLPVVTGSETLVGAGEAATAAAGDFGAATTDEAKGDGAVEDTEGNPLLSRAQFQELESQLRAVDRWAVGFRTDVLPVVDRLRASRNLARMTELAQEEWRLDELERAKAQIETEGDGALVESDVALSPALASTVYHVAKRASRLETKLRRMLGLAWEVHYDGGNKRKPYYFNVDTREMSWERPRLLDQTEQRKLTIEKRWGALPPAAMQRVQALLGGLARVQGLPKLSRAWAQCLQATSEVVDCWIYPVDKNPRALRPWLTVGVRIEARYLGGEVWYPGTVFDVNADGTMDILYTDGEIERGISPEFVRLDPGGCFTVVQQDVQFVEVWSKTLGSSFGCGVQLSPPRVSCCDLAAELARAKPGEVLVLSAGVFHLEGKLVVPRGVLVIGEAMWAWRCQRFGVALLRVLPNAAKLSSNEANQRDWPVVDPKRASVIKGGEIVVFGRCDGLCFDSDVGSSLELDAGASLAWCLVNARADGDGPALIARAPGLVLEDCRVSGVVVKNGASVDFIRCILDDTVASEEGNLGVRMVKCSGAGARSKKRPAPVSLSRATPAPGAPPATKRTRKR